MRRRRRRQIKKLLISASILLMIWIFAVYYVFPYLPQSAQPTIFQDVKIELPSWNLSFSFWSKGKISPIFTKEVQSWGKDIAKWGKENNIDPNLVATVMQIESCGNPRAVSRAGAKGLFQVMPFHFSAFENAYNPNTNAKRGMGYLRKSLDAAGNDPKLALAGYNGGIGVISRAESNWPHETQRYVRYGVPIYYDAVSGLTESPSLTEWYQKYGASMCADAAKRLGIN